MLSDTNVVAPLGGYDFKQFKIIITLLVTYDVTCPRVFSASGIITLNYDETSGTLSRDRVTPPRMFYDFLSFFLRDEKKYRRSVYIHFYPCRAPLHIERFSYK